MKKNKPSHYPRAGAGQKRTSMHAFNPFSHHIIQGVTKFVVISLPKGMFRLTTTRGRCRLLVVVC